MVNFTTLSAGGIDYYQDSEPTSGKDGELWLPIEMTTALDPSETTGVTVRNQISSAADDAFAIDYSNEVVFTGGSYDNYKYDFETGDELAMYGNAGNSPVDDMVLGDGKVFYSQNDYSHVEAVQKSYDSSVWTKSIKTTNIQFNNYTLYVSDAANDLLAFEPDGTQVWSKTGFTSLADFTVTDNYIAVCDDRDLIVYDRADRSEIFSVQPFGTSGPNTVEIIDGYVYAIYSVGEIAKYDVTDGTEQYNKTNSASNADITKTIGGQIVYGQNGNNEFGIIDTSDGTVVFKKDVRQLPTEFEGITDLAVKGSLFINTSNSNNIFELTIDASKTQPVPFETGKPHIYYNGSWLPLE